MTEIQKGLTFVLILFGLVVGGWLLVLLSPVLTPFLIALVLAYLCDPIVERLSHFGKFRMPRTFAVCVVFAVLTLLLLLVVIYLIPVLNRQIRELISAIPAGMQWIQTELMPKLESMTGFKVEHYDLAQVQKTLVSHWTKASDLVSWISQWIFHSSLALVHWIINLLLIAVVTFYLLRDWHKLLSGLKSLMPNSSQDKVITLVKKSDVVMGSFVRGQLGIMLFLGVIYAVGLTLIGVKFSVLLGLSAGLLSLVPYLGSIAGLLITLVVALVQSHEWALLLWVALVFGVGHLIEGMILTPLLLGDKLGLHPVAVIFAVLAGGQLLGMVGVLIAIPLTAILVVLLRDPILGWAKSS